MAGMFWIYFFMFFPLVVITLIIVVVVLILIMYPHRIRIRELASGRKIILDDRAREFKDENGNTWWKLLKETNIDKKFIPIPPSEAIELNKKGKKCVEAYRVETGEIFFIHDPTDKNIFGEFQPLTTKQRLILINNIKRAQERKTKRVMEYIPMIAGLGALILIVFALFIFWGDIARPVIDANDQQIKIQELQKEQLELIKEIKQGIQKIEAEQMIINDNLKVSNKTIQAPN